jgi:hypothetical protein
VLNPDFTLLIFPPVHALFCLHFPPLPLKQQAEVWEGNFMMMEAREGDATQINLVLSYDNGHKTGVGISRE